MAKGSAVAIDIDISCRLGDRVIAARFTAGPGLTALFGPREPDPYEKQPPPKDPHGSPAA